MLVVLPVCKAGSFEGRMCAKWVRDRARAETQAVVVRFSRARTNPDRCCRCTFKRHIMLGSIAGLCSLLHYWVGTFFVDFCQTNIVVSVRDLSRVG